jgi:hypothetical protein
MCCRYNVANVILCMSYFWRRSSWDVSYHMFHFIFSNLISYNSEAVSTFYNVDPVSSCNKPVFYNVIHYFLGCTPSRWVSPKLWFLFIRLHGITSQEIMILLFSITRTWNRCFILQIECEQAPKFARRILNILVQMRYVL